MLKFDERFVGRNGRRSNVGGELEEHDPAAVRQAAVAQAGEHLAAVEREEFPQFVPMQLEHLAVVTGVGHDKDHEINVAVPLLEPNAASESLDVSQPGFQLTGSGSPMHDRHAVPCPAIAWDREWHLGPPDGARRQSLPESFRKSEMGGIACWITVGKRFEADAQADGCGRPRSLIESQSVELAPLDPAELRVGHASDGTGASLADPGAHPAGEELRSERDPEALGDSSPVEGRLIPRRHAAQLASEALPRRYLGLLATLPALRLPIGSHCGPSEASAAGQLSVGTLGDPIREWTVVRVASCSTGGPGRLNGRGRERAAGPEAGGPVG